MRDQTCAPGNDTWCGTQASSTSYHEDFDCTPPDSTSPDNDCGMLSSTATHEDSDCKRMAVDNDCSNIQSVDPITRYEDDDCSESGHDVDCANPTGFGETVFKDNACSGTTTDQDCGMPELSVLGKHTDSDCEVSGSDSYEDDDDGI